MAKVARVILVDSSVWISYFAGVATPEVSRLWRAFESNEDICVLDLIIAEVLQGVRSDRAFDEAREALTKLVVRPPSVETYVGAARLFRALRGKGVTIRGTIDCIIAEVCIELGATLLTADRDFKMIEKHSALELTPL